MTERDAFEREAKRLLEQHAEALDQETLAALRDARRKAARLAEQPARRRMPAWLAPAGGLALASAALLLWLNAPSTPREQAAAAAIEDVEILSSGVEPELLDNLDFCQWLAEQEPNQG